MIWYLPCICLAFHFFFCRNVNARVTWQFNALRPSFNDVMRQGVGNRFQPLKETDCPLLSKRISPIKKCPAQRHFETCTQI